MYTIPFQVSKTQFSIFLVLTDENLKRMKEYDPAELTIEKFYPHVRELTLKDVIIGYATQEEVIKLLTLKREEIPAYLKHLSRGWAYRPELGDNDFNYEPL